MRMRCKVYKAILNKQKLVKGDIMWYHIAYEIKEKLHMWLLL